MVLFDASKVAEELCSFDLVEFVFATKEAVRLGILRFKKMVLLDLHFDECPKLIEWDFVFLSLLVEQLRVDGSHNIKLRMIQEA